MKGLLILILLLPGLCAQEPTLHEDSYPVDTSIYVVGDIQEYSKFIEELDQFNRELGGCPRRGSGLECVPGAGIFDLKLWKDLCKKAPRIFKVVSQKTNAKPVIPRSR